MLSLSLSFPLLLCVCMSMCVLTWLSSKDTYVRLQNPLISSVTSHFYTSDLGLDLLSVWFSVCGSLSSSSSPSPLSLFFSGKLAETKPIFFVQMERIVLRTSLQEWNKFTIKCLSSGCMTKLYRCMRNQRIMTEAALATGGSSCIMYNPVNKAK